MKKKRKTRLLALVVTIFMLAAFTLGCSGGGESDADKDQSPVKTGTSENINDASNLPLLTYNVFTFTQSIPAWVNEEDDEMGKYVENRFKIKVGDVSFLQGMTFKERMNLFIAVGDLPDVVQVYGDTVTVPSTGRYAELGDLIKQNCPNYMKLVPEEAWKDQLYNGRLYDFGQPAVDGADYPDDPYASPNQTWAQFVTSEGVLAKCGYTYTPLEEINKQINESGKKPTADLYKIEPEIKTPDDFYNFLKKIKEVYPKVNGQDVIPFSIPIWLEPHFGYTFGLSGWWKYDPDTKKVNSFLDDKYSKDYWKFMNKLYNEGLLDKNFAVQKLEQMNDNILNGRIKSFMWSSTYPSHQDVQTAIKKADPNDNIRAIRLPVQPGANPAGIDHQGKTSGTYFFINKDFKDIPRLLKYWDWCLSQEANELCQWGPESLELWEMKDGKRVWKDEEMHKALNDGNMDYLKTRYYGKGLGFGFDSLSSKAFCSRTVPVISGYNPYTWKKSYKFEISPNDYITQNVYVSAGGWDTKGYLSPGGNDATNKVNDFIYGEFEQQFSAKLFAAKNDADFEKAWEETIKYFNEKIGYSTAKKDMELILKARGFDIAAD